MELTTKLNELKLSIILKIIANVPRKGRGGGGGGGIYAKK